MEKYLPHYLINIILDYDGRIKYKNGKYINIIHKHDFRYNIIEPLIEKKKEIMKHTCTSSSRFYFEFSFNNEFPMGLCYDYGWSYNNTAFEICFYNFKNNNIQQIRTFL
jgi:hypothetical protein